ncbi:MAG: T9SS type A sorting domain-containing protein, partial [Bacteroidales bacterium]|nr:T9SS type A sorting domain-containing protein [Bacteroidales bacterium]
VFAWQHSEAGLWYLALWKEVSSDTVLIQSLTETVEVAGLDTSVWYTAQLRAVCDTGNISEWTDTVMFYLPNWDTTGTEPIEVSVAEDHNVRILPNPTRGKVTILSSGSIQKVTLVDSEGREMFVRQVDGNTVMLDLSGYASGIYIIRVETESGVSVNRLVKK